MSRPRPSEVLGDRSDPHCGPALVLGAPRLNIDNVY